MQSNFTPQPPRVGATASPFTDETYNLLGLNMAMPDQVMPAGETPYTINSRMYAREAGQSRVANRTRFGTAKNTEAVGETLDTQNQAAVTDDIFFSPTRIVAQPFTPTTDGALTRLDLALQRGASPTGHVMVEVRADALGKPGALLAASSILGSQITSTYANLPVYLIDAPSVLHTLQYWIVLYIQDNGGGFYSVQETAAAGRLESNDGMETWGTIGNSFRYKTYISPAYGVKGYFRRYPSNGLNRTMFAAKDTVYAADDVGGVTAIDTGLATAPTYTRFDHVDDKTVWCNGVNNARWWDGTTVVDVPGAPASPTHVIIHQNRMFLVTNKVRVQYSELYDFTTWPSVNFFYVPNPKASDPVAGWVKFQNNLIIFTNTSKHIIRGSDVSTFQRDEAVGTKGAVSQEAIAVDHNYIYFMAPDGQIYRWNGVQDELISDKMQPEFQSITNLAGVRLHLYRNQLRVYYAKQPSVANDHMALYDISYKQWFMDTGRPVTGSLELTQDSNQLLEFSSLVGQVYNAESANFSDLGKPLDYKYWTRYNSYSYRRRTGQTVGGGSAQKRIRRFHPLIRTDDADYTLSVGRDFDFANLPDMRAYVVSGGGAKWGQFRWGDGTKYGRKRMVDKLTSLSGRGKHLQYRFERRGVETPVELYGYISQLKIGRQK